MCYGSANIRIISIGTNFSVRHDFDGKEKNSLRKIRNKK